MSALDKTDNQYQMPDVHDSNFRKDSNIASPNSVGDFPWPANSSARPGVENILQPRLPPGVLLTVRTIMSWL